MKKIAAFFLLLVIALPAGAVEDGQVMYVGGSIIAAGIAAAALFDGTVLSAEARGFDVDAPAGREKSTMASHAGGQNAVEHIHA